MKLLDIIHKIKACFIKQGIEKQDYFVKKRIISFLNIPYSAFLIIKQYGLADFFYKSINYTNLFIIKTQTFYRRAIHSLNGEGLKVVTIRALTFIISGKGALNRGRSFSGNIDFIAWIGKIDIAGIKKIKGEINKFKLKPTISIITPVYNVDAKWLNACIQSVTGQFYENWELCLYDDASTKKGTLECLRKWEKTDLRINISYGREYKHISGASNEALKMATGEFVALLDSTDELKDDALFWIVNEINAHPDADLIYTDECKKTLDNNYVDFLFKPDWSPEFLLNDMYTGHLSVYRKDIIEKVGLFRSAHDFSRDYDLALRVSEVTEKIYHIERVLYFWRQIEGSATSENKEIGRKSNLAALDDAMKRRGVKAKIVEYPWANRAKILSSNNQDISLIIPSDSYSNIVKSVEAIIGKTSYPNYEIVVVTNSDLIKKLKPVKENIPGKLVFSLYDKKYNFSDKCNRGATDATGEILVFLNDDVFPIMDDWLENIVEYLHYDKRIGGVSPMLLWENNTIQYAGMTTNVNPFCGTFLNGKSQDEILAKRVRNTSILSGACFAIWKKVFLEIGGFDAVNTPAGHSDLDLSFKLREKEYRCVYTPYATLYHMGNHSWHIKKDKADIFILSKWGKYVSNDPFYTKSMRTKMEGYLPEEFGIFSHQNEFKPYLYDALIVLHELKVNGAAIVALNTAKTIIKEGGYPVIYSYADGPLRAEFEKINVPIIINCLARRDEYAFRQFAKNFDKIMIRTCFRMSRIWHAGSKISRK
jgi:GT2 family glycosyltransferase